MVSAVITAAGRGTRLNGVLPKQYLELAGQPLLRRTLAAFVLHEGIDEIILVVPGEDMDYCRQRIIAPVKEAGCPVRLVPGGRHRQDSVRKGLLAVAGGSERVVAVHDGARPFVSGELISRCLDGLTTGFDGCIAALPAGDTLKKTDHQGLILETIDRSQVWLAQTPQVFHHQLILKVHVEAHEKGRTATDDASLVEQAGGRVRVVAGSAVNIKITIPEDLPLAEAIAAGF